VTTLTGPAGNLLLLSIWPRPSEPDPRHLDALTGLPDRRELQRHYEHLRQSASPTPHAVLFMDLDHFKRVNDGLGHAVGDKVLAELASRWQACVREGDLVARYGGDEFVALLASVANRQAVELIAARLAEATSQPVSVGKDELSLTVTIGIAFTEDPSNDLNALIAAADHAMYAAKKEETG
ncbi:MAG: GGDEF domain-containing protein, partial [Pirellulales bacterium]|nr:GGDEF domain-containing protein [Pirellulales bacterium]